MRGQELTDRQDFVWPPHYTYTPTAKRWGRVTDAKRNARAGAYAGRSLAFQAVARSSAPPRPDTGCALRLEGRPGIATPPPRESVDADGVPRGRVSSPMA